MSLNLFHSSPNIGSWCGPLILTHRPAMDMPECGPRCPVWASLCHWWSRLWTDVHQPLIPWSSLVTSIFTPNSGPKGVINDWRRFKQLETEQREEQCREMERLIKKLSLSCRSHLDEEEEQQKQKDLQEKISGKVIRSTQASLTSYPWSPVFNCY